MDSFRLGFPKYICMDEHKHTLKQSGPLLPPPVIMTYALFPDADKYSLSLHVLLVITESRSEVTADTLVLSSSDFPALSSTVAAEATATSPQEGQGAPQEDPESEATLKAQEKAARKAAKKAAAAEKAAERQKIAQEKAAAKAAEKARVAQEKAIEKEKAAALKAQQDKEKAENEQMEKAKAKAEREKERAARAERERLAQIEREKAAEIEKEKAVKRAAAAAAKAEAQIKREVASSKASSNVKQAPPPPPDPVAQVPLLSKKPKKNKPIAKPIKLPKEEEHAHYESSTISSATPSDAPAPNVKGSTASSNNSRSHSLDRNNNNIPTSIEEFLEDIHTLNPHLNLLDHPFFDLSKINPAAKMPLEYAPLVHALSALSVGGGSFANNVPSGSIDNAVSSFQQLLETLTQTISDLLRLLPRTTWDDSSSFDGVLRDMLKGDDFLDETGEDSHGREDEVAALTLALERRARWMEVQLSKLEELHRDINTAAVRAVLAFNDNGWDWQGFLPRVGNTVKRFDSIGLVEEFVGRGDDDDDDDDDSNDDDDELASAATGVAGSFSRVTDDGAGALANSAAKSCT